MEYFAGLDVSLETVNVCIVNAAGGRRAPRIAPCRSTDRS
jgi:hypothetical protein